MNNQSNYINFPIWKSNILSHLRKINEVVYKTKQLHGYSGAKKNKIKRLNLVRIKLLRSCYLYLNRTILYVYTYSKGFQDFIKTSYATTERLISQLNTTENENLYFTDKERKYFKLTQKTLKKYAVVGKNMDIRKYGIFIKLVLKHTFCNDIANYICEFI